ncbi:MAG: hypothetical protein MJE77_20780 [Proteobacteria bacterium]|nr:hypothetical protein [Pseudomonadota bacterium]
MLISVLVGAAVTAVASFSALAQPAGAGNGNEARARARAHFERARALFAEQQYERAGEEYLRAADLVDRPMLLFNAAQAFRLSGHSERALALYRQYLQRDPDGRGADAAGKWVSELSAAIEAQNQAEAEARARQREADERARKEAEAKVEAERQREAERRRMEAETRRQEAEQSQRRGLLSADWTGAAHIALDYKARGAAVQLAGGLGVGEYVQVRAAGLVGPTLGAYLGGVVYPAAFGPDGAWKPLVGAGLPLFFSDGVRYGVRVCTGLEWQMSRRIHLSADVGVEHVFNPEWNRQATALVPMLGIRAQP